MSQILFLQINSTQTEITQSQMPLKIHHNILRLQVSVKDLSFVQLLHSKQHLSKTKLSLTFTKFGLSQVEKKLSARVELKQKVKMALTLESSL